ncbi:TonB-dependent receptor [Granulicella arctica]|uniref:TonB-dependent transporter Oar-like beta-barrel domain-containing protein n=1 Tax=Granulicella arctica TaxID=940613 RepID=A0A7Y9PFR4_9BACT|nr:TonB-dependent receptor [Granulicella arctica]NYF78321.1 hypothetical protein [Granulicella arctica]
MQSKFVRGAIFLGVCSLLLSSSSFGQAVYGSIFGTVTDSSGAVVPNATITVTDEAKGTSFTAQSNASGEFTVEHLIPDPYDVKVVATGFAGFEQKGIQLFADTSTKVTAALQVGNAAGETITVNADAVPQMKTDRADVSTVFSGKEIQDLPIGDRNFTNLQLLLPGAQQLGWSHAPDENPQGSKQIQVDGQAFGGVAFELDGTDNQDPILGIIVINPNVDSLSESKITTQNFDAEFGKAVSSVVTAQTKSGSNKFHGSLFDYRESTANLARDPFTQANGTPTVFPPGLKNQFGGSVGGPIRKDKIFFFADYQGVRQKVGTSELQTVPSAHLISTCLGTSVSASGTAGCDFSEYVNAGATTAIYNPATGTAYANNVIPTSQLSAPALNLLKLLQPYTPNRQGGKFPGLVDNYAGGGTGLFNSNQWDVRGDYQVNDRVHAFGRFSRFTDVLSGKALFGAAGGSGFGLGGYGGVSNGANDSLALGTDIAVNPKLVTDIRLGYYRYNIIDQKIDQATNTATNLGIPGENLGTLTTGGAPGFNIIEVGYFGAPNGSTTGNGTAQGPQYGNGLNVNRCNCPLTEREDQFQVVNNWTKTLGNHSVKFGADLRYARNLRVPSDNDRTGINAFGTGPTSNGGGGSTGLGFATFVLGDVTNFNRYVSTSTNAKEFQKRDFFYVQDTWRVTQKLTLNLGLRYEFYFPETVNATGNGALLNLSTGYLQVAGVGNIGSNMSYGKPGNPYNPRIGMAYQATPSTVVRAGYGRSFDMGVFGSVFGHTSTQNLPVLANQQIATTGGATAHAFDLATGPSAYVFPAVPSDGLLPSPGYAVDSKARPTTLRLPTIDAWNLSIQQALTPTLSLTMAYVGNKGTHTLSAGDGNSTNPNEAAISLPAQYSVVGQPLHYDPNVLSTTVGIPGGPAGISANYGTANTTYLSRYYGGKLAACADPAYTNTTAGAAAVAGLPAGACGWTNAIQYDGDDQNTHFNALQVTLTKQTSHGLTMNVNYAWQRGFNFANNFATWSKTAVYGRDDSIREQQVVGYGTYELPFGRNKYFLGHANTIVNEVIGGWQFSPVINYSSGLPFTLSYSECGQSIPTSSAPCYVNGNAKSLKTKSVGFPGGPNGLSFYNSVVLGGTSGFSAAGLDQIGNTGRNSRFGPRFFNGDLSLQKNFPIKESILAQFRVDAFNGFNHINYGNPGGNVEQTGSITAGPGVNGSSTPRQLQFSLRAQF